MEHMEQRDGEMKGGWGVEGGEREKLSGKCLSLSQQPEECDGQIDNCYFRLPGKKLSLI